LIQLTTHTLKIRSLVVHYSFFKFISVLILLGIFMQPAQAQKISNLVYVDKKGILRYTAGNREASFFGVNYTVPFAYGYRSHKALGVDLEKAIDADVYHMSRLGLDAFRVHVWDVEITDSLGNLLENDHLRLFDYLLKKLKEKNIKILLTPIAFWGNGYPERDQKTIGFSSVYGKGPSVVLEASIRAQENYMQQFFTHVNPYTGLSYRDDPDIIAAEINNEPHHSGPKEKTTEYVNRLSAAIRKTGWTKPIFYNISESPSYADAVAKSNVDGFSFQWYPTGLVANREQKGNYLPQVAQYRIPFRDTIPAFQNRALMVYEFDAGDVGQSIMYPAMVRSFRTAGFQWATQFAYDPMYTAHANTEYQTHYLNLAYTPSKAISLLIASKTFHLLPLGKSNGPFPSDSVFGNFRISYHNDLSEMVTEEEFYHTNNTTTAPKNPSKLQHIAGVGNSALVEYGGNGAYFLDRIDAKTWRLELMPDVIPLRDPYERASPQKTVRAIRWQAHTMRLRLAGLPASFQVIPLTDSLGSSAGSVVDHSFSISPGVYLVTTNREVNIKSRVDQKAYYAPASSYNDPVLIHHPPGRVQALQPFILYAEAYGLDTSDRITIELRNTSGKFKTMPMQLKSEGHYEVRVPPGDPADMGLPGILEYRFILRKKNGTVYRFPGGYTGDPFAWNDIRQDRYQTSVIPSEIPFELFSPSRDRGRIVPYNPDWRNNTIEYSFAGTPGQLVMKATIKDPSDQKGMGAQVYFGDHVNQIKVNPGAKIVVRARSNTQGRKLKLGLITTSGKTYVAATELNSDFRDIEIPLSQFRTDSLLLLPRPYPGFQPLWFSSAVAGSGDFSLEKFQFIFGMDADRNLKTPLSIEIASVFLQQ
jgi:hypothetical protein